MTNGKKHVDPISPFPMNLPATLEEMERKYIDEALKLTDGQRAAAAKLLGLNRTTLVEKLKRYGYPTRTRIEITDLQRRASDKQVIEIPMDLAEWIRSELLGVGMNVGGLRRDNTTLDDRLKVTAWLASLDEGIRRVKRGDRDVEEKDEVPGSRDG